MRTVLLIALKDVRQRVRDKSAFLYGIVAPLALAAIFSLVFNPIQDAEFTARYLYVDLDGGPIAESFVGALGGMGDDSGITVEEAESVEAATALVEEGMQGQEGEDQADAAFVIPEGFSQQVLGGGGGSLEVVVSRGSGLAGQIAYSLAEGFAAELDAVDVAVKTTLGPEHEPGAEEVAMLAREAARTENPITVEDVTSETRQLDGTTYLAAGMAALFVFFSIQFGVSGLLEERRLGTMSRLLAAPISRRSILGGKAATAFMLGVSSMGVLAVGTSLLLGADWGHPVGVALLILAMVFAAMGILAVVSAAAKTQEQAANFQAIVALVLGFLGGTFFPISQIGGALATLSLATPHAWFLRGLGDLAGGEVSAVLPSVGALLLFGLVTGAAAWGFLQKAVRP